MWVKWIENFIKNQIYAMQIKLYLYLLNQIKIYTRTYTHARACHVWLFVACTAYTTFRISSFQKGDIFFLLLTDNLKNEELMYPSFIKRARLKTICHVIVQRKKDWNKSKIANKDRDAFFTSVRRRTCST